MISRVQFWLLIAALNGAIWFVVLRARTTTNARVAEQAARESSQGAPVKEKPVPPIVIRTNAFQWGQLESEDYRTYINRLRSIDCPEETIRDIIISDLEKLMAPDVQATEGNRDTPKYWEPKTRERTVDTLARAGQKQDIDFKKREIVRELLGIDLASERSRVKGERDFYEERLGFLEPEKQMRVRMAIEKANREESLLREESWLENDELTTEDKKEIREIQQRKTGEIEQVLTPEEFERYNLWFSTSAYHVRDAFLVLEPNEQDFLALYRFQKEFDDRWGGLDLNTLTPEEKWQYQQAQNKLNDQIHEHLGQERYEKFLQTREPDFQQMQDTIVQFGLKPEVAGEVYGFKKVLVEERTHVNATASIDPVQKQEILKALSEETEKAVVETMGPKAYRYYVRSGAGKWISQ
jgi:hypothetical protein